MAATYNHKHTGFLHVIVKIFSFFYQGDTDYDFVRDILVVDSPLPAPSKHTHTYTLSKINWRLLGTHMDAVTLP